MISVSVPQPAASLLFTRQHHRNCNHHRESGCANVNPGGILRLDWSHLMVARWVTADYTDTPCETCDGKGGTVTRYDSNVDGPLDRPVLSHDECQDCDGTGRRSVVGQQVTIVTTCETCGGKGYIRTECGRWRCDGGQLWDPEGVDWDACPVCRDDECPDCTNSERVIGVATVAERLDIEQGPSCRSDHFASVWPDGSLWVGGEDISDQRHGLDWSPGRWAWRLENVEAAK